MQTMTPPEMKLQDDTCQDDVRTFPRMKILLVDDEPMNVALLEDMLSDAGYKQIRSVTDSRTALDVCNEFGPDLVLLDLMMPHVDGFAILDALRSDGGE